MPRSCPDCGSSDALSFIADVGQEVCSNCGAVLDDFQIYDATSAHEVAYSLGGSIDHRLHASSIQSLVGPAGRPLWSNTLEDSRRLNEYHRKPEVDARIQGILATLGHPGLFSAVEFLFQRAREASWKEAPAASPSSAILDADDTEEASTSLPSVMVPRRVRWGHASVLLATACCYAVLRRERVHIDIETVSEAAHLPASKVKRSFRLLKLLVSDAVRHIRLANPDSYVHRILVFFKFQLSKRSSSVFSKTVASFLEPLRASASKVNADPARIFVNTRFEAIQATALDLCEFWWPKRSRFATEPQLAAFAIVVVAIEAHLKLPAPIYDIFRHTYQALRYDPLTPRRVEEGSASIPQLTSQDTLSKTTIALHSEVCRALQQEASKIPWLSDMVTLTHRRQISKASKRSSKSVESKSSDMSDLVRRELLVHVLDILDVWRAIAAKSRAGDQKQETDSITSGAQEADASADMHAVRSEHGASDGRDSGAASEKDLDEDELNCFLATAPSAFGEGENVGTTDGSGGATEPLLEASDRQGCWSRVAIRLREGGVLQGPTTETHPIDLLSDDQVDQWLFDNNELDSLLRTDPTELALFEQAKVAAGDWPVKSADERNAEFTSLAWSVAQDLASNDQSASSWRRMDERDRHKRKERSSNTIEAETPDSSTLRQNKRAGPPSPVSLREQQEESDWSD